LNKKLILGTAQLNNQYGILNLKKKNESEIFKFLEHCAFNNIKQFDTAEGYNNHKILGKFFKSNHKYFKPTIFTKVDSITKNNYTNKLRIELLKKKIEIILNDLTIIPHTILFHNAQDSEFLKKNFYDIKEIISNFGIMNIGSSIYDLKEFRLLSSLKNIAFQVPLNPTNLQFKLKVQKNYKIIARSIFLQGLLINLKLKNIPKILLKPYSNYVNFVVKNKINPINFCMNFINQQNIYKFIIGVDNKNQLNQILNYDKEKINSQYLKKISSFFSKKSRDPRQWLR